MRAEQKAQEGTAERRGGQELPTGQVRQEQATSWPWGLSWCSCFLPEGPARRVPFQGPEPSGRDHRRFSQASRATWPPAGLHGGGGQTKSHLAWGAQGEGIIHPSCIRLAHLMTASIAQALASRWAALP